MFLMQSLLRNDFKAKIKIKRSTLEEKYKIRIANITRLVIESETGKAQKKQIIS